MNPDTESNVQSGGGYAIAALLVSLFGLLLLVVFATTESGAIPLFGALLTGVAIKGAPGPR